MRQRRLQLQQRQLYVLPQLHSVTQLGRLKPQRGSRLAMEPRTPASSRRAREFGRLVSSASYTK